MDLSRISLFDAFFLMAFVGFKKYCGDLKYFVRAVIVYNLG